MYKERKIPKMLDPEKTWIIPPEDGGWGVVYYDGERLAWGDIDELFEWLAGAFGATIAYGAFKDEDWIPDNKTVKRTQLEVRKARQERWDREELAKQLRDEAERLRVRAAALLGEPNA